MLHCGMILNAKKLELLEEGPIVFSTMELFPKKHFIAVVSDFFFFFKLNPHCFQVGRIELGDRPTEEL